MYQFKVSCTESFISSVGNIQIFAPGFMDFDMFQGKISMSFDFETPQNMYWIIDLSFTFALSIDFINLNWLFQTFLRF